MENGRNAALNGGRGSGQTVRRITEIYEEKIADLKANFDYILEGKENEYREERNKLCDDFENMKAGLESQIAQLGERCNQLLKDKGNLTDKNKRLELIILGNQEEIAELEQELQDLKDRHAEEVELHLHAEDYIKSLEQQIEKMKRHCNCKHRDSEGYCEVKRTYLMDLSYDGCDKWELED